MNKRSLLAHVACVGSILVSACATEGIPTAPASAAKARFETPLDSVLRGTWEGALAPRPPFSSSAKNAPPDTADLHLRLVIQDEAAKVYLEDSGEWIEAMPGKFNFTRIVTSATIVGMNSSDPVNWIESWSVLVTAIDDNNLRAEWTRVVTNIDSGTEGLPTFGMAATGLLRRVSQ